MTLIRHSLGTIADILSILAFLGLTATGFVTWLSVAGGASWILAAVLFIVTFVIPIIALLTIKRWGLKASRWLWKKSFTPFEEQPLVLTTAQLSAKLPSDRQIRKLYNTALKRIEDWDSNAAITKIQFGITIHSQTVSWNFLTEAESTWKHYWAQFVTYAGTLRGQREFSEALNRPQSKIALNPERPFYKIMPGWRNEIVRIYGPIEKSQKTSLRINIVAEAGQADIKIYVHDNLKDQLKQENGGSNTTTPRASVGTKMSIL